MYSCIFLDKNLFTQHITGLYILFLCILLTVTFFFNCSVKARNKVTKMINNAIVHYRDDIDLQNLIDFGQKEVNTFHLNAYVLLSFIIGHYEYQRSSRLK